MQNRHVFLCGVALGLLALAPGQAQQAKIGDLIPASDFSNPLEISKPALAAQGGSLILSDSPEEIYDGITIPGAFYRDSVRGIFRVFYHHQNNTENDLSVGLVITNTSRQIEVLLSHGRGASTSVYPNAAGQTALADFLASHLHLSFVAILKPGESYYSVQDTISGDTASGLEEYVLLAIPGAQSSLSIPAALFGLLPDDPAESRGSQAIAAALPSPWTLGSGSVTTLVYSGSQPTQPATLPILASDGHVRGTFPHFDRLGAFTIAAASGLQYLAIDTSAPGEPWSDDMPGEYELGVDAVDANLSVYDDGNYGILYRFLVNIENGEPFSLSPMGLLMQPTGGAGSYVMRVNHRTLQSPYVDYTSAWWFDKIASHNRSRTILLETSLAGGDAGPQEVLFAPAFSGN